MNEPIPDEVKQRLEELNEFGEEIEPAADVPPKKNLETDFDEWDGLIRVEEEDTGHLLMKYNCYEKRIEIKTTVGRAGDKDIWLVDIQELLNVGRSNIFNPHPVRVVKAKRLAPSDEE